MASMVAKASGSSTSQLLPAMPVQEKGSRNKRKFRADPPIGDPNKIVSLPQSECSSYEFSAEKFEIIPSHGHPSGCDMCSISQDHSDALKLDLGLSTAVGSTEVGPSRSREEIEAADEFHDADWSDLTESQLEELVLSNLDTIFRGAIKKIVAHGYSEEIATKAVLRSGLCYGCKDTVSNIVDNTLAFLRNGQEIDRSREHYFEDLQQMEKYILAELVCVLREVRPFFSTGDAMWCLLICDMNVSHACAMDGDPLSSLVGDGCPDGGNSVPAQPQLRTEARSSELNLPNPCKPSPSIACSHTCKCETASMASIPFAHSSQSETPTVSGIPNFVKPKNSFVVNGVIPEKDSPISTSDGVDKSVGVVGTTHSHAHEEKFVGSRKISGITKREYILRQKSLHLEKSYRTYGSKGSSRVGKLSGFGGLILDKKLKSLSDSTSVNVKNASLKISKTIGVDVPQDNGTHNLSLSTNVGLPSSVAFNVETVNPISTLPKTNNIPSSLPTVSTPPALSAAADTELSLSFPTKNIAAPIPISSNVEANNSSYAGVPFDKSLAQWVPQDKKDEMILKLFPRVQELQNQLQEWTEWANHKVMQAARRLGKDKAELKTLRQEKEEVERLKKEKQTLEESTMKKLSEMENALCKASGQVDRANTAVRRLEVENAALRQEMEAAKLRASESAASCQEVSKREKKTLMKFQSWEKQKTWFQEEIVAEKRKLAQLQQEQDQAKYLRDQLEARWKQEEKAKEELLSQANSIKKEREQIEASAKSEEDMIKLKAETNLQKYKDDIKKLEIEISQLRLKTDSSKIAALRRGVPLNLQRRSRRRRRRRRGMNEEVGVERASLEQSPGIFIIGSSNVGKRTLLSRLLSVDFEDASDSSSDVLAYGWTINTKYYTADVSVWMAHLHDDFSIGALPIYDRLAALVMVFDMSDLSSLAALKEWVSHTDIQNFEILLCIGNKVDLLPGHSAHVEYRRRLHKLGESSFDPEFSEYGISETEGVSLLGDEESPFEIKRSCLEWCTQHNIEYIEACASNADFDRCLSVDGDLQGVERIYGALSAHMWPGMVLKSGDKITEPSLPEKQELSEEESDYEFEYEVLSAGSAEPWDDTDGWVSADGSVAPTFVGGSASQNIESKESGGEKEIGSVGRDHQPSTSMSHSLEEVDREVLPNAHEPDKASELDKGTHYDFEDLEQLMSEIGNMRDSLRLMPDFQRREMAANLALKMAAMFGDSSGDDEEGCD